MRSFAFSGKILLCLFGVVALVFMSCNKETAKTEERDIVLDDEYIDPAMEQFREPLDARISYKKARNFNKASEALVIMGQKWAEEIELADNEEKLKITAAYEKAQDDLIRKFGIAGKEEFKWIHTKALPDSSNRDVFVRAGVWIKRD
ncbi:MAG: hypothetical protein LBU89_03490 [Fibromonadaceae bacterium]|jgi:spermidine/putrescine-binding protein|nr:hypothetical protein [Fibromonadaceae bacterium]